MVWDILGAAAFVLASTTVWMVTSTLRQLGIRDPAALSPFLRRALMVREIPEQTVADFARSRPGGTRVAFIANPTKQGMVQVRETAYRACSMRYLPEPMWLYTTATDPGGIAAREAVAAGAEVLIAVGGDGTVRAVAAEAADAGIAMGIVPMGTGNLLARNLDIPVNDTAAALRNALDGEERAIDMGWLHVTDEHGEEADHLFLVFAGMGIDAEMVAGANASLKSRWGWGAYFWAAVPFLNGKRMRASLTVDSGAPVVSKMRSVLAANAGKLPGGLTLLPDARVDDGKLDFAILDARGGVAGWAELFGEVIAKGAGISTPNLPPGWRAGRIDHARGETATIEMEVPHRVQADGEPLGRASKVRASVQPGRLKVRAPKQASN